MAIQRIQQFITHIQSIEDENSLKAVCANEITYLRNAYEVQDFPNEKGIYSGLGTYRASIRDYRKAIYKLDKNHAAYNFFQISQSDRQNYTYQRGKSTMRNYVNRMRGDIFTIENPLEYIKTSIQLLYAPSYIDNILGIAALTGRRVNEIAVSCEFDYCDYDDVYNVYHQFDELMNLDSLDMLIVYGLSKKHTYLDTKDKDDSAIIPILCDMELVIKALSELRKLKSFEDANDFHNKASKDLSKKVKKRYGEYIGDKCTAHDLRKAYARLSYDFMVNEQVKGDDGLLPFVELCLGQNVPDNYMKFSTTK